MLRPMVNRPFGRPFKAPLCQSGEGLAENWAQVVLRSSRMAQDKSAEIINFSGAAEPPQPAAPLDSEAPAVDKPSSALEAAGAGAYLRDARAKAKLSIEAVSNATKVKAEHLEAIEWMRLDRLPALPYVIGFVKTYASHLGLDAEAVAAKFKTEAGMLSASLVTESPSPAAPVEPAGDGARLGSLFAMMAVALFALWVGYQVLTGANKSSDISATSTTTVEPEATQAQALKAPMQAPVMADEAAPMDEQVETVTPEQNSTAAIEIPAGANIGEEAIAENSPAVEDEISANVTATAEAPVVSEPPRARPLPRRARPVTPRVRQSVIIEARLTRSVAPEYPNRCTRGAADLESVTIRFDVSVEGRPANERVLSSTNSCFESEALRTVRRWRFNPRTVDGVQAVESAKTATVRFAK